MQVLAERIEEGYAGFQLQTIVAAIYLKRDRDHRHSCNSRGGSSGRSLGL
jgi:hypothetical protein